MRSLCAGFLVAALIFLGHGGALAQEQSPLVGKKAPDFTLERVSGSSASLSQVIKDKKAIVFFFATWCPHCREQLKQIAGRKADLDKQGVVIVLVNVGESKDTAAKFLKDRGIAYDTFLDVNSFVSEVYQVAGIPTLVFIGTDGKIRYVEYGLPDNYEEILK